MFATGMSARLLPRRPIRFPVYANRVILAGVAFVLIAWLLAGGVGAFLASPPIASADRDLIAAMRAFASPAVTETLSAISRLHGTAGILAMAALVAAWLSWKKREDLLPVLLAGVPGGLLLNVAVKNAVGRVRPDPAFAVENLATFSFPSGHTAGAVVLYGFVAILLWPHCSIASRALLAIAAVALVIAVAVSRIVLGMHYPSDCLASVVEGMLWLAVCFGAARASRA